MNETIFIIIIIVVMVVILIMASMMYKKKKSSGQRLVLGSDNQFEIVDQNKNVMSSSELTEEIVQKDFPLKFEFSQARNVQFANQCPPKMYMFENNGGYFCCKTQPSCQVIDMYGNKKCGCSTDICSLKTENTQGNQLCYSNLYVE